MTSTSGHDEKQTQDQGQPETNIKANAVMHEGILIRDAQWPQKTTDFKVLSPTQWRYGTVD